MICNNTFKAPVKEVVIRGVPEEQCHVYQNWFLKHENPKDAVHEGERTNVFDNLYDDNQIFFIYFNMRLLRILRVGLRN